MACGIVYEHVLGQDIHTYQIKAFPTYVLFRGSTNELGRITGVNFDGIKSLVEQHCKTTSVFDGEGKSLGGGGAAASAADARAQRLARFGGSGAAAVGDATESVDSEMMKEQAEENVVPDEEMKESAGAATEVGADTKMMDVDDEVVNADSADKEEVEMVDPTEGLKSDDIAALTDSMGFSLLRAQKGLLHGNGTVEGAVEWLLEHQEDDNIDDPIEMVPKSSTSAGGDGGLVAQSYKCNDCGKILSNMANLELHANKTGHSDFEESTEHKRPLTAEEKEAKIQEIKSLLKAKRTEREDKEKVENVEREKQRRFMGKEMAKTREQMEIDERKRIAQARKREKETAIRERQRIRAELEKDKLERMANKGKLGSRLGVDGYHPDAIQYDAPSGDAHKDAAVPAVKKVAPSVAKMDEYITKVSSYRAGGDGGNCLKILKAYIGNVVKHPDDPKYRKINMENNAYRMKVKPFLGAKSLLLCVGFAPTTDGTALELTEDADMAVLKQAEEKVEAAYQKYTK